MGCYSLPNLGRCCLKATLTLLIMLAGDSYTASAAISSYTSAEPLDISKEPTPKDWKRFMKQPAQKRLQLWRYFAKRGQLLGSWSWGWRIGWVRTCTFSKENYCGDILRAALFDDAVVVRSEAAVRLGRRYEKTGNTIVLDLLKQAYLNSRNMRRGKPLFVQNRILFAIKQVGGDAAITLGAKLAARHPNSQRYWQKISSI